MSTSRCTSSKKADNAVRNRSDIGWQHGIDVNGNGRQVKCKYCSESFLGGVYRFKHHLAGTHDNAKACTSVPDDVKNQMLSILGKSIKSIKKRKRKFYDLLENDSTEEVEVKLHKKGKNIMQDFLKEESKPVLKQLSINQTGKRPLKEDVYAQIARFFYTSAIPFNCVKNPEFAKMLELVGRYGARLQPPSYNDLREKFLQKEVIRISEMLEEFTAAWRKTGCSIMCDGWTNNKRLSICNFLVNCPKGTVFLCSIDTSEISKTKEKVFEMLDDVVKMVGEEHVVQVVTDNAANYEEAGEMLMKKRKSLFWTPCAARCIDSILEDFGKKLADHRVTIAKANTITTFIYARRTLISWMKEFTNNRDLIRPAVTGFATSYLTLGCLSELKEELIAMFSSCKWKSSKFASLEVGKKVHKIVMDNSFWKNVKICLKAAFPLIKVLRLVDGEDKPAMGFIYEAMDRAKEKIELNFMNVKKGYEPILDIVNTRWESQLHRPLHAAAYYLNPHFHYSSTFKPGFRIKIGLYKCIQTMVATEAEQTLIDSQIEYFTNAKGLFGLDTAKRTRTLKSPEDWWDSYGDECPELQKFAIRVLSLTCSSSGRERNWSAFEMVHSKRRNRLHQKKINDLVFVMYNMKLMERQKKRETNSVDSSEYAIDDISSDDEWITEREDPVLPTQKRWMRMLDKVTECGTKDSDEESQELEREVKTQDVRAALDAGNDFVIHDVDDDNDADIPDEDENEKVTFTKDDDNIEVLDEELMGDPNVPEEEYEDGNDSDDGHEDGAQLEDLY